MEGYKLNLVKKDRCHNKNSMTDGGCKLWSRCLTCPAPDCVWEIGASLEKQGKIIETWGGFFERAKEKYADKN